VTGLPSDLRAVNNIPSAIHYFASNHQPHAGKPQLFSVIDASLVTCPGLSRGCPL
jgi:hypothetical protein